SVGASDARRERGTTEDHMKNSAIALGALLLLGALAAPAHATSCTAGMLNLNSGGRVVYGSTDVFDVSEVRVVSNQGEVVRMVIPVSDGSFAELLDFAIEPNDSFDLVFVRKDNRVICMQSI